MTLSQDARHSPPHVDSGRLDSEQ